MGSFGCRKPAVIMVVGVNGGGKTTSLGNAISLDVLFFCNHLGKSFRGKRWQNGKVEHCDLKYHWLES